MQAISVMPGADRTDMQLYRTFFKFVIDSMKNIPVRQIKDHAPHQAQAGKFSIRKLDDVLDGKDLVQDLHRHNFFFVLVVEKGKGKHEIDFISHTVSDNNIFILRPGQVHQLQLSVGSSGYIMAFDTSFYQSKDHVANHRLKKAVSKNFCNLELARFNKLIDLMHTVFREHTLKEDGYLDAIAAHLDLFFIEYTRQSRNPAQVPQPGGDYAQERYEQLMQLLEEKFTELKSVSDYAQLLNLSSYQLNAITKSAVGKTVSELINAQIVLESKRLLLATSNQVKDIAYELGYEDVSYFIRFFRKQTGHAPESFRQNFK